MKLQADTEAPKFHEEVEIMKFKEGEGGETRVPTLGDVQLQCCYLGLVVTFYLRATT